MRTFRLLCDVVPDCREAPLPNHRDILQSCAGTLSIRAMDTLNKLV